MSVEARCRSVEEIDAEKEMHKQMLEQLKHKVAQENN
jgi:hypothetical protein